MGGDNEQYPFVVVDTDYEGYAIVYECGISLGFQRTEKLWIMTRDAIVRDSSKFNDMWNKVSPKIQALFKTDTPGNEYYIDKRNWLAAPVQGSDYC